MKCDHIGCRLEPMRAPRVIVPAVAFLEPGHRALKMMTTLHYCELHKGELQIDDLLGAKVRRSFEQLGRLLRPVGFKCDFDNAFIEWVLVTTPEYRAWMQRLGGDRIMAMAMEAA